MTDDNDPQAGAGDDPVYAYKPSLMAAPWELRLKGDALTWRAGRHEGRVPYGRIARVRLSFRPATMQTRRFVTELWPAGMTTVEGTETIVGSLTTNDTTSGSVVSVLRVTVAMYGCTPTPPVTMAPGAIVTASAGVSSSEVVLSPSGTTSNAAEIEFMPTAEAVKTAVSG